MPLLIKNRVQNIESFKKKVFTILDCLFVFDINKFKLYLCIVSLNHKLSTVKTDLSFLYLKS